METSPQLETVFPFDLDQPPHTTTTTTISTGTEVPHSSSGTTEDFANRTDLPYPQYYGPAYQAIGCFFVSVIFVVGLFGNVMVVVVVWQTKSMHTTTNCYLVSLAFADIILLISAPLPTIAEFFLIVDQFIFGRIGCSMMVFFQYLGVNVSSLSITAFTIERYIAICHPMKAQAMCTISRAKKIISTLWVLGVAYCAPWLALATTKPIRFHGDVVIEACSHTLKRDSYATYYVLDLLLFYAVPLALTCLLYGLIARVLNTSARLGGTPGSRLDSSHRMEHSRREANGTSEKNWQNSTCHSRIQVTKMLAVVVCVFAVLWLPYRVFVVYNSFARRPYDDVWFILFCRLMVYANSAINPVLYNAMSVKFRWAFGRLLCCRKQRAQTRNGVSQYTQVSHAASGQECLEMRSAKTGVSSVILSA